MKTVNTSEINVFKRPGRDDFYFKFTFNKKTYLRSTQEPTRQKEAERRAIIKRNEIIEAILKEDYASIAQKKLRQAVLPTVQQLLAAYDISSVDAEKKTRTKNKLAMRQLLRLTYPEAANELTLPISAINGAVARKWFETASAKSLAAPSQEAKTSTKRSANSRFVHAKSLFLPRALATYRDQGVYHDAFTEFLQTSESFYFTRLPRVGYVPPEHLIAPTLEAWPALTDRNVYLAIGFALAFGLRRRELSQARWSWLSEREYPVLDSTLDKNDVHTKNRTGIIQVRALDPWYHQMMARIEKEKWNTGPDDFILAGTRTDREENTFRESGAWMRGLGWKTQKTNHEFRKFAGSQIAMRYHIYDAQCWLRHNSVAVTEQHYAVYVNKFKPADITSIVAHWAPSSAKVVPLHLVSAPTEQEQPLEVATA